jgi:hypothetical protein
MSGLQPQETTHAPAASFAPVRGSLLQRACACGQHTGNGGECETCRQKRLNMQRRATSQTTPDVAPPIFTQPRFEHDFSEVPLLISAQLPGPLLDDDPIHRPIIEGHRREHGLPAGGVDESWQRVGLSDAEIKYRGLATRDASVFYVNFQNTTPPNAPDHTQQHPGPGGAAAHRAGFTRVHLGKRMNIAWDIGPAQSDGRIPLFAKSVNIFYRLDPIEVHVSSDYATNSCPYRVTLEHERSHVRDFLRIFHSGREPLVSMLEQVAVPTEDVPRFVDSSDVEAVQDEIGEQLRQVILSHSSALVAQMEADRNAKDAPTAYAAVYARCPPNEW